MAAQSMIERVAFVLAVRFGHIYAHGTHEEAWVQMRENNAPSYRHCIEAAAEAIDAMRKPTPKMLRAAGAALSPGKRPTEKRVSERAKHGIRYRAMIDAALEETK